MNRVIVFLILLGGISCQSERAIEREAIQPFFDLDAFFQTEIDRMTGDKTVERNILFMGKRDKQKLDNWDAKEELEGFKDLNINRVAWRDQYLVDSLRDENHQLEGLRYTAIDSSLRIREVAVDFTASGEVSEVRVEKYIKNLVVHFHQKLRYRPGTGYWLWREQKVPLTKRSEMKIEVAY
ncbi:MAG: hypothetical protein H6563_14135 [Lewinellaceae bacterium]|nr:hypothetical protein [Lewinellaceae bacterium]